ncbi:unnamed protein product, partial [marine sediment metagenome]
KVLDLPGPGEDEEFVRRVLDYGKDPNNRLLRALLDAEKLEIPDYEAFAQFMATFLFTCGNCMLVCWPELEDRKENYRLLMTSGRVVKGDKGPVVVRDSGLNAPTVTARTSAA